MFVLVFCILLWQVNAKMDFHSPEADSDYLRSTLKNMEVELQRLKFQQAISQEHLHSLLQEHVDLKSRYTQCEHETNQLRHSQRATHEDLLSLKSQMENYQRKNARSAGKSHKRILLNNPDISQSTLDNMQHELQQLKTDYLREQKQTSDALTQLEASKGTTYVHWGKLDCPNNTNTSLIYSGITGGTTYSVSGGAADFLCLPHDSQYIYGITLQCPTCFSGVYGSEYQFGFREVRLDDDVPCAVCHTRSSATFMVPAHNSCPDGWKKEYQGILSTNKDTSKTASQYVCLDDDPQYFEGTRVNKDGKLFYPTKTVCGSLPCPPYMDDQYLPCVICSK